MTEVLGFPAQYIQSCAADFPTVECPHQRFQVDDVLAANVGDVNAILHQGEFTVANEISRVRSQW